MKELLQKWIGLTVDAERRAVYDAGSEHIWVRIYDGFAPDPQEPRS